MTTEPPIVVQTPTFDAKGFPDWNPELEEMLKSHPHPKGWTVVVFEEEPDVWRCAFLGGHFQQGVHRLWLVRTILLLGKTDDTMKYSIYFWYNGEDRVLPDGNMKMYPRLPVREKATGNISGANDYPPIFEEKFKKLDIHVENIHHKVVKSMGETGVIPWLLKRWGRNK